MEAWIELKNEIVRISARNGFSSILLEKDYYLTKILQRININNLVFKGGTCLNKCHLGFYRLSEDLDFVVNEKWDTLSKSQAKKRIGKIRNSFFEYLESCQISTNKELGVGWKMITTDRIIRLELIGTYSSIIDNSKQQIKIEVSFYHELFLPVVTKSILHEFYDVLGDPILPIDKTITCISLEENIAEKYRALVTRPSIAIRDLFDISIILDKTSVSINLILAKIQEAVEMSKEEFLKEIQNISNSISTKPLEVVLKKDVDINMSLILEKVKKGVDQ